MPAIEQGYQTNLHKALFLSRELIRIVDRLSALGVEVMPYKGLALAEVIYGDIALRQAGDIDLLIHPQDLPRIREAVRELGYPPHMILSEGGGTRLPAIGIRMRIRRHSRPQSS